MNQNCYQLVDDHVLISNLSIPLVHHCVNACAACSTFSPVCDPYCMSKDQIKKDVYNFKRIVRAKQIELVGGEPLLNPDFLEIVDIVRESGISPRIIVVTNGQLLHKMPREFWEKLDQVLVTRYPGKFTDKEFLDLCDKASSFGKPLLHHAVAPSPGQQPPSVLTGDWLFSKGFTRHTNTRAEAIYVWRQCQVGGWCAPLINGRFHYCLEFYYRKLVGVTPEDFSVDVETITLEQLWRYVNPTEPAPACYRCTGLLNGLEPWREIRDRAEWYKQSEAP
jgi:hypothetical protein